ncbi:Hypothetical_protein [Hexamita inflata]|uniref:Hypothetical_protein n=1 Tax=Hexamita inflata TaxID=28002 RepID=A0AA86PQK1_9EUKA|nr:Hypothetical protein HINF_LOCUS30673 [Hexamita inflata]CAI9950548.1 Hypothetical protein HINF_LOCUS38193 [Hexamita inflata]
MKGPPQKLQQLKIANLSNVDVPSSSSSLMNYSSSTFFKKDDKGSISVGSKHEAQILSTNRDLLMQLERVKNIETYSNNVQKLIFQMFSQQQEQCEKLGKKVKVKHIK